MEPQNKKRRLSLSLQVWYKNQQVGVNTLKTFLSDLSIAAGVDVCYTNHCLRATDISRMFTSGISEKVITEKSGHRSLTGLRPYEKTSDHQQEAGRAIAALEQSTFENEEKHKMGSRDADKNPEITAQSFPGAELNNCTINIIYKTSDTYIHFSVI